MACPAAKCHLPVLGKETCALREQVGAVWTPTLGSRAVLSDEQRFSWPLSFVILSSGGAQVDTMQMILWRGASWLLRMTPAVLPAEVDSVVLPVADRACPPGGGFPLHHCHPGQSRCRTVKNTWQVETRQLVSWKKEQGHDQMHGLPFFPRGRRGRQTSGYETVWIVAGLGHRGQEE